MLRWNFLLHSCEYKWLRHKCRRILKMLSLQLCDIFLQHYVISKIWLIKPFIIFHLKKIFIILNIQYITSLKNFFCFVYLYEQKDWKHLYRWTLYLYTWRRFLVAEQLYMHSCVPVYLSVCLSSVFDMRYLSVWINRIF